MVRNNIVIGDLVKLTESARWNIDYDAGDLGIGLVVDTKSAIHGFPIIVYVQWENSLKPISTRWIEVFYGNR